MLDVIALENIYKIIEKHIDIYHRLMEETNDKYKINDYASAISALIMLKRELSGEIEY